MSNASVNPERAPPMQQDESQAQCHDLASVVRAGLPVSCSSQGPGVRGQFLKDLKRAWRNAYVRSIDIIDMEVVFRGVQSPTLGVGMASGSFRPQNAARRAFQAAGSRDTPHALIVAAFAPGDMRIGEGKSAAREIFQHLNTDCFLDVGVIEDENIPCGFIRVSVLLG